jgi:FSR family fosmidomycin resistance protein-like MFS transporter
MSDVYVEIGRGALPSAMATGKARAVPYNATLALGTYSVSHALVDAATVGLVLSRPGLGGEGLFLLILLYNVLAFGTQFLLGILVDRYRAPRGGAAAGCLLAAMGIVAAGADPWIAAVLAGFGNSLFHVGAGSLSLNINPGKAAAPGIFVAPGALGLFGGVTLAKMGAYHGPTFILLMLIACAAILFQQGPPVRYERRDLKVAPDYFEILLIILLLTVLVRALVGMTVAFPWKSDLSLMGVLIAVIVIGKGLGGILADRFGWRRVAVTGLLISAPLLTFLGDTPYLGIAGAFFFQMTMAVTLTAVACLFPGRSAFAFGLPCLALIIGALPGFTEYKSVVGADGILFAVILASAALLWMGLGLLSRLGIRTEGASAAGNDRGD